MGEFPVMKKNFIYNLESVRRREISKNLGATWKVRALTTGKSFSALRDPRTYKFHSFLDETRSPCRVSFFLLALATLFSSHLCSTFISQPIGTFD